MKKILIAVPSLGNIRCELAARLAYWASLRTHQISVYLTANFTPVARARNNIVKTFLEHKDQEYLFMVDADTVPPMDALQKLVDADKEVVTGVVPAAINNPDTGQFERVMMTLKQKKKNSMEYNEYIGKGVEKIDRAGAACILIKRPVVEKLKKDAADPVDGDYPLFKTIMSEDGLTTRMGEDAYFCDRLREAGIDLYAHFDVVCQHIREHAI